MKKIKLEEIARIRTGFQVRSPLTSIDMGSHFVIQMRNISPESGVVLDDIDFCKVTPNAHGLHRYLLRAGEVILLTRGNNHPATLITEDYNDFVAAGQFMVLTLESGDVCLPEYLCWFLNAPEAKSYFGREARGSGVKIIDKNIVGSLIVPLPDLQTQGNIVKLGKLALKEEKLLDSLKEKRKQLIFGYCKQRIT
ncbi:MAG: restriction endonuclease subunit S [Syntrophaceae bacterium]|nr:restriction endonuclease subunit S [Syntrophaceae bacterium]